jgi:hypothetical protein
MEPSSTTTPPSIYASPNFNGGSRRTRRCAARVVKRIAAGVPVPSPKVKVDPAAVVTRRFPTLPISVEAPDPSTASCRVDCLRPPRSEVMPAGGRRWIASSYARLDSGHLVTRFGAELWSAPKSQSAIAVALVGSFDFSQVVRHSLVSKRNHSRRASRRLDASSSRSSASPLSVRSENSTSTKGAGHRARRLLLAPFPEQSSAARI